MTKEINKEFDQLRNDLIKEYIDLVKVLGKDPKSRASHKGIKLTRELFLANSKFIADDYRKVFGGFVTFRQEALATVATINRDDIDISKDYSPFNNRLRFNKKYFVTSFIAGAQLYRGFFDSIQTFCKYNDAELIGIPMRGISSRDEGFDPDVEALVEYFATHIIFNNKLAAYDFVINPQMINPLTSLGRYGQKQSSLIVASPKQQMITVPTSNSKSPHVLYSTGTATRPVYRYTRQGALAQQDHIFGGLIIEVENNTTFHVRQVQANTKDGSFRDINKQYFSNGKVKDISIEAISLGDYHNGYQDSGAIKSWFEVIDLTKPKYIFYHDFFDGTSISHHHEHDMHAQLRRNSKMFSLEMELDLYVSEMKLWANKYKKIQHVIVRSNHDEHLDRYLTEGRYAKDRVNHELSLKLAQYCINELNPIEEYVTSKVKLNNVKWLKREEDFKVCGIQMSAHGDKGPDGARGSASKIELSYGKAITGHTHKPTILRDIWINGCSCRFDLDYTKGSPSSWMHGSTIVHKDGSRQQIISKNGKWRI